ncbi:MAG: preprotein translocase subunit SecG [Actinomycetota bacterium]|nr:preprotein translocase subunit SecG [Actinomycetota bacterium]
MVVFHVLSAAALVMFILLHAGRGGGLSEMFGGGLGGGVGGSTAVERNLDRITIVTALVFATTTILLVLNLK